ncbi:anti-sigma factor antagonist [Planobispora siamensis]|uniref:Anti-sigma factor antagonist n=2 Tax=Planobispora siamensis TaxID=936338 RepID=A0A8J3SM17_9ACTN|nr:anti-sigma factor antagonist [Planobispora siamensis]
MESFRMAAQHSDGSVLVTVTGELDIATRPELCDYVDRLLRPRPGTLVLDLSEVTFMDACGLGALIILRRHATERGTRLAICGASPAVSSVISMTELTSFFPVCPEAAAPFDGPQRRPPPEHASAGTGGYGLYLIVGGNRFNL